MSNPVVQPHGRFRRALQRVGVGAFFFLTFTGAAVTGAVLHLNTPAARRIVVHTLGDVLHSSLAGDLRIEGLSHLGVFHLRLHDVTVNDPRGARVMWLHGVDARFNALAIAKSALIDKGDLRIIIDKVSVDHAEVVTEQGPSTAMTLQEAFQPREFGPPLPDDPTARPLVLSLGHISLGSAWIHGKVAPPTALDAEVHGLRAAFSLLPDGISLNLEPTAIEDRSVLPVKIAGTAKGRFLTRGDVITAEGGFHGSVGAIDVGVDGSMDDDRVLATVDIPRVTPEALSPFVAEPPLTRPVAVQVRAEGTLPAIGLEARVAEVDAPSRAVLVGSQIDVDAPMRARVQVSARDIDPRLFALKAPPGSINARVDARVVLGEGLPTVVADVNTEPTTIAGQLVPALDAHVDFAGGVLGGTVAVDEQGAPIAGSFAMTTEDQRARFEVEGAVPALHGSPRIADLLGGAIDGSVQLRVRGSFADGRLDARANTNFSVVPGSTKVGLRHGALEGHVRGPLDALTADVALTGDGLVAMDRQFDRITARVEGPVRAPRVSATLASADRFIGATAEVDTEAQAARHIRLDLRHGDAAAHAAVESVQSGPSGLRVAGIDLRGDGVGTIQGSVFLGARGVTGKVHGEAVDIGRIVDLAGLPIEVAGLTSFDVALAQGKRGPEGHVALELEGGAYEDTRGLSAHLTTTIHGDDLRADGYVRLIAATEEDAQQKERRSEGDGKRFVRAAAKLAAQQDGLASAFFAAERCGGSVAKLQLEGAQAKIKGSLLDARTWENARGETTLHAEDVDLRCLRRALNVSLPEGVSDIGGVVSTSLRVIRGERMPLASIRDISVATRGLVVRGAKDPETGAATWESRGIDVAFKGDIDGETGLAQTSLQVLDKKVLLDFSAATTLDLAALLGDPERQKRALKAAPIAAHLSIPRRALKDFSSLPSFLRDQIPAVTGQVQFDAYAAGSVSEPRVAVRAMGFNLTQAAVEGNGRAQKARNDYTLDMDIGAFYDSHAGKLDAYVAHGKSELARASAEVKADLNAVLAAKPGANIPWTGAMHAKLTDLPLGQLPYIAERNIGGVLRGEVAIEGLNQKPTIAVDLSALDLRMGPDMFVDEAKIALHVGPDGGEGDKATLEANMLTQDGGKLAASADLGIQWKAGAVPVVDAKRGASAMVEAQRFRLAAAQPFLGETISRLDGFLDGRVDMSWAHFGEMQNATLKGTLRVTDGVIEIPTMGQELSEAKLTLVAEPSGRIHIDDLTAKGRSGSFRGSAEALLEGGTLKSAHAKLDIPNGEDLPITVEGVPIGNARGQLSVDAQSKGNTLDVAVKIPNFHLDLPSSIGKSVQTLDAHEDIVVLQPVEPPTPKEVPPTPPSEEDTEGPKEKNAEGPKEKGDEAPKEKNAEAQPARPGGTKIVMGVDLGNIYVEGSGIDAVITDNPKAPLRIVIDEKTEVAGDIRVLRGRVEVLGKVFDIEPESLVHLRPEDVANPYLNVTANWASPDGTKVYIAYVGDLEPISQDKLKFRSDPPKSEQEVVSLLLFGPDYAQGTVAGGASSGPSKSATETATGAAASVGSSIASSQINQVLNGIGPLKGLEVKLGTNDSGSLSTSVGYKISNEITATASFGGTNNASGQSPSALSSGGNGPMGTSTTAFGLEWRFKPHWSLRASVGAEKTWTTTGIDLLWTRRY